MLDTNVFNNVLDKTISLDEFAGCRLMATPVQQAELCATSDAKRRRELLQVFKNIAPELVPASSFCFGIPGAGWGETKWNDGSGRFKEMLERLVYLDRANGRHKRQSGTRLIANQISDVVIAETALKAGALLISADGNLCTVMKEFGGSASSPEKMR